MGGFVSVTRVKVHHETQGIIGTISQYASMYIKKKKKKKKLTTMDVEEINQHALK